MQPLSILSILHLYKSSSWPPLLTSSTHWPEAKPVSGQGPDPLTLARAPGPMGRGGQCCDPGSEGYLLLSHNAIGHSYQNDEAQGILHADHSNGCWAQACQSLLKSQQNVKMALLILCHRCLFCAFWVVFFASYAFCVLNAAVGPFPHGQG